MFKFYNGLLEKYPIGTKSLTSGSLFSVGDALTQFSSLVLIKFLKINLSAGNAMSISSSWEQLTLHLHFTDGIANFSQEYKQLSSLILQKQSRFSVR